MWLRWTLVGSSVGSFLTWFLYKTRENRKYDLCTKQEKLDKRSPVTNHVAFFLESLFCTLFGVDKMFHLL